MSDRDAIERAIENELDSMTTEYVMNHRGSVAEQIRWRLERDEMLALDIPAEITSPVEADALPPDAVIRDAGGYVLQRQPVGFSPGKKWFTLGYPGLSRTCSIDFPATVLYQPKEDQ